ncbi:MAG TPA: D-glycerate dehydrogenase [Vicinamibacterales bacterium]|nr:D-glycerate dehydrogenase [Vicinamibacterales bacterium]
MTKTRPRVLVTRRLPASAVELLEGHVELDMHVGDTALTPEQMRDRVRDKDALIVLLSDRIDRAVIESAPSLRIIANVAVGFDNIDVAHAAARGVIVTNTPDVLTDAVADLTWALILAVTRRLGEGERIVRAGAWKGWSFEFMLGTSLAGKQLGIVGPGRIGRAVGARAGAFGMSVAYASRTPVEWAGAEPMSLDRLLATSDVVSLHVPLRPETRRLIDQRALARMKRTAYLVNTTRGAVVDEAALVWALKERLIAGAALDVFEREPEVHPGLLELENVVLTPHLGSATRETRMAMAELAVKNVLAVLRGEHPLTPVVHG